MQNQEEKHPKPFSKENTKAIVCKVIFFYSVFYVVIKFIAILKGLWLLPNLILSIPFIVFAAIGFKITKSKSYSWAYVIIGIIFISAIRYYETDLMLWLKEVL